MKFSFFFFVFLFIASFCIESSFIFNSTLIKETGNYWFTAENVCFQFYGARCTYMNIYNYPPDDLIKKLIDIKFSFSFWPDFKSDISVDEKFNDEEIWLTSSCLNDNICHFLDNMFLYNIEGDNRYPPMNHLIMADYNPQSTLPYNNMMLKLMINNYKKPFKISFESDLLKMFRKSGNILCYKRVHIYIRSLNGFFPAVFREYRIGRKYRDEGYKYLKINVNEKEYNNNNNNNEIIITIINRQMKARPRSITNIKLIKSMIKSLGYKYNEVCFDNKNPKEQIESIMTSKLIITPSGSSTVNIMWIISPKSIVVDFIGTYVMVDWAYLSYSLNYRYIPLFTLFHNINTNTFDNNCIESLKFNNSPTTVYPVHKVGLSHIFNTSGNNMTISLRQIYFSLKYSLNYLLS